MGAASAASTRRLDRQLASRVRYLMHETRSIKTDVNETKGLKAIVVGMRTDMRTLHLTVATLVGEFTGFKSVMVKELHSVNAKVDAQGLTLNRLVSANIEVNNLSTVDWATLHQCLKALKMTMRC